MKTLKYIALSLLAAACTTACKDDPELLTTDVGPEMTAVSSDASGVFGGKVGFEATMTDRYALSTLKAQIFFDDEMVAEEVIRTKENGTYSGTVTLPFYKNVPDGEATLNVEGEAWHMVCKDGKATVEPGDPAAAPMLTKMQAQDLMFSPLSRALHPDMPAEWFPISL